MVSSVVIEIEVNNKSPLTQLCNRVFVSDCLVLYVYKERGVKERCSVTLEHICGLETHVCGDGVSFTLSILCLTQTAVLGFDSSEALHSWDLRIRYYLGEGGRVLSSLYIPRYLLHIHDVTSKMTGLICNNPFKTLILIMHAAIMTSQ